MNRFAFRIKSDPVTRGRLLAILIGNEGEKPALLAGNRTVGVQAVGAGRGIEENGHRLPRDISAVASAFQESKFLLQEIQSFTV